MDGFSQMQNPHEAEQNVLLERIIRKVVRHQLTLPQDKCNEAMVEMNQCLRVSVWSRAQWYGRWEMPVW
jgi:hypothetical protein